MFSERRTEGVWINQKRTGSTVCYEEKGQKTKRGRARLCTTRYAPQHRTARCCRDSRCATGVGGLEAENHWIRSARTIFKPSLQGFERLQEQELGCFRGSFRCFRWPDPSSQFPFLRLSGSPKPKLMQVSPQDTRYLVHVTNSPL